MVTSLCAQLVLTVHQERLRVRVVAISASRLCDMVIVTEPVPQRRMPVSDTEVTEGLTRTASRAPALPVVRGPVRAPSLRVFLYAVERSSLRLTVKPPAHRPCLVNRHILNTSATGTTPQTLSVC